MKKSNVFKGFLVLALTVGTLWNTKAQFAITADPMGGKPMVGESYLDVEGSPYLFEDWKIGSVVMEDGHTYQNVRLMYDEVIGQLIFQNNQGVSQAFVKPVKSFTIYDEQGDSVLFSTGFLPNRDNFYQVLVAGDTWLLKRVKKVLMDEKQYGSAKTFRNVIPSTAYFIYDNGQLVEIKFGKKRVLGALNDRQVEIAQYIDDNRLSLKNETDLISVVSFYNTL